MKTFLTAVAGGKMRKSLQSSVTAVSISAFLDGVGTDVISVIRNTGMFFYNAEKQNISDNVLNKTK